jgi:hypothetical protein
VSARYRICALGEESPFWSLSEIFPVISRIRRQASQDPGPPDPRLRSHSHTFLLQIQLPLQLSSPPQFILNCFPRKSIEKLKGIATPNKLAKLAQSRPPPVRTHHAGTSPPPLSPRTHSEKEKRHHSRRRSGKEFVIIPEKKPSSRPAAPRKSTPQYVTKVGHGYSSGRSSSRHRERERERERERDEDHSARDSGESFPQYW